MFPVKHPMDPYEQDAAKLNMIDTNDQEIHHFSMKMNLLHLL